MRRAERGGLMTDYIGSRGSETLNGGNGDGRSLDQARDENDSNVMAISALTPVAECTT